MDGGQDKGNLRKSLTQIAIIVTLFIIGKKSSYLKYLKGTINIPKHSPPSLFIFL